jgi:hypothetical protein
MAALGNEHSLPQGMLGHYKLHVGQTWFLFILDNSAQHPEDSQPVFVEWMNEFCSASHSDRAEALEWKKVIPYTVII